MKTAFVTKALSGCDEGKEHSCLLRSCCMPLIPYKSLTKLLEVEHPALVCITILWVARQLQTQVKLGNRETRIEPRTKLLQGKETVGFLFSKETQSY